jgi:phospholipid-binding lipoprotein MlaA
MPVVLSVVALSLIGCGTVSRSVRSEVMEIGGDETSPPIPPRFTRGETSDPIPPRFARGATADLIPPQSVEAATPLDDVADAESLAAPAGLLLAQTPETQTPETQTPDADAEDFEPYDPWESFNETMFELNLKLDRYLFKPVANVYRHIIPEPFQVLIANGFDNIRFVPRFINNLLQGKPGGAGRELARFLINSTAGIGGLFDPAKDYWGIPPSREDFGQTLGVWGSGPGPYLVLPFLEPMTVRDGIGRGVDMFLDPLSYVLPLFWDRVGMKIGEMVNERALYYDLFQGVQETSLDMYSSVRHFYLLRRERQIKE